MSDGGREGGREGGGGCEYGWERGCVFVLQGVFVHALLYRRTLCCCVSTLACCANENVVR